MGQHGGMVFRRFVVSSGTALKDTSAIAMISVGVQLIQKGDYLIGGGLVAAGWALLVLDRFLVGGGE
jgi:hypothetical protein